MPLTASSVEVASASREATEVLIKKHAREYQRLFSQRLQNAVQAQHVVKAAVASAKVSVTPKQRMSHLTTPVFDSAGKQIEKDMIVRTPDGGTGKVIRLNRSQSRVVVERENGEHKMVVSRRLTVS